MPDLVKGIPSRPSARWKYLIFDTSATWTDKGTAAGKGDCPTLVRRGTRSGQLQPHFSISTYRGGLEGSVAEPSLPPRWILGNWVHAHEAAKFAIGERGPFSFA